MASLPLGNTRENKIIINDHLPLAKGSLSEATSRQNNNKTDTQILMDISSIWHKLLAQIHMISQTQNKSPNIKVIEPLYHP